MKLPKREFFINRIMSSSLYYNYKGMELEIRDPSADVKYRASILYHKYYDMCVNNGVLTDDEYYKTLLNTGLWTEEEEKSLMEGIPKDIDKLKTQLYLNYGRPAKTDNIKKFLHKLREEQMRLVERRNIYTTYSAETSASIIQKEFEVQHSTFLNGEKFDWSDYDVKDAVGYYYSNVISDKQIRELARTAPWTTYLSANKYINDMFGKPVSMLSKDQLALLSWSSMYESISNHPEPPISPIIEDDDSLDGWLIIQKQENEKRSNERAGQRMVNNSKIAEHDEVFIVPDKEAIGSDIDTIQSLNSSHAAVVRKSRIAQIQREGHVDHNKLNDVKQGIDIAKNQLIRDSIRKAKQ